MSKDKQIALRLYDIIRKPLITEKAFNSREKLGQYYFQVQQSAAKVDIKQAVEEMFKVKVLSVNTLNRKGKTKMFRGRLGSKEDIKRAVVRLQQGYTIDIEGA